MPLIANALVTRLRASRVVVDATGAGDMFCGAFLAGILEGDAMENAARHASVAAALKCTGYGAVAPIPSAAGVRAVFAGGLAPRGQGLAPRGQGNELPAP